VARVHGAERRIVKQVCGAGRCGVAGSGGALLLMVISLCFYTTKTINKTLFLGANKQRHSDLGANNLVPHVYVIICL
jgi:hypothetical protein